jgi:hypothetical protein
MAIGNEADVDSECCAERCESFLNFGRNIPKGNAAGALCAVNYGLCRREKWLPAIDATAVAADRAGPDFLRSTDGFRAQH